MFPIRFYYLKFIFLSSFFFSPSFALAWNNMCYSPVQMSALLSKPKSRTAGVGKIRKKIKQTQKTISMVEEALNDAEAELAASLDGSQMGEAPAKVAGKIRDYMESKLDDWGCGRDQSFLNKYLSFPPFLFEVLSPIPSAFAEKGNPRDAKGPSAKGNPTGTRTLQGTGGNKNSGGITICPKGQSAHQGKCVSENHLKCMTTGGKWVNKSCTCPAGMVLRQHQCVSNERACNNIPGNVWHGEAKKCCPGTSPLLVNGQCAKTKPDTPQTACQKAGKVWKGGKCECPSNQVLLGDKKCYPCADSKKIVKNNKCVCPDSMEDVQGQCVVKQLKVVPAPAPKTISRPSPKPVVVPPSQGGPREPVVVPPPQGPREPVGSAFPEDDCPEWKRHRAFRSNGRVDSSFCNDYSKNKKQCKRALKELKNLAQDIVELEDSKSELRKTLFEIQKAGLSATESSTEASGLCFDCLKRVMISSQPTASQNLGNFLNILSGVGVGYLGYKTGQRAQTDANMLRLQQGYAAQHDYYSLMGASAGYPFMAQGIYGMTRTNTPVGGWSCSPVMSPYGHIHNYQYGQGLNMRYY